MARQQLDLHPDRQPLIEIERLEATAICNTVHNSEFSCSIDRYIGTIDGQHRQTSQREPDRPGTNSASDVQGRPRFGEHVNDTGKPRWGRWHWSARRLAVSPVPTGTVVDRHVGIVSMQQCRFAGDEPRNLIVREGRSADGGQQPPCRRLRRTARPA